MIGYIGLTKIELPNHTAYLTDGGFITFGGARYMAKDSLLGSWASFELMTEGKTGEIPAYDYSFNVPDGAAVSTFQSGALQAASVKTWLAKYDVDTNQIIGTPTLSVSGQIDQPIVQITGSSFELSLTVVSKAEWFFSGDTGNGLSATFHKDLYAGETGHDNGTGLSVATSWGTEGAVGGGTTSGSVNPYQNPNTRVQN